MTGFKCRLMNKDQMKIKVALFGPHDRFNYGDFLFPLMVEYAFEKVCPDKFQFTKYALVNSDFTSLGAYKSKSYRRLVSNINANKEDVLIVAGGECIGATWHTLFRYINSLFFEWSNIDNRVFRKLKQYQIARRWLGGKSEYPYCVNKTDFKRSFLLLFNSVGAAYGINELNKKALKKADYIAFREQISVNHSKENNIQGHLVPDSAIILSDVYPLANLEQRVLKDSVIIRNLIRSRDSYLYFQIGYYYIEDKLNEIVDALLLLSREFKLKVVLCPIGIANSHEDHRALELISQKANSNDFILVKSPSIQEIMLLIAKSKLYIGTSLHGLITAMSYGVPYLGLNRDTIKLRSYLDTWSCDELNMISDVNDFFDQAHNILLSKQDYYKLIIEKTKEQKQLYYDSVKRMIDIILKNR